MLNNYIHNENVIKVNYNINYIIENKLLLEIQQIAFLTPSLTISININIFLYLII